MCNLQGKVELCSFLYKLNLFWAYWLDFTRMWGFYLEGVWLWRISGGYSQEMKGLVLDRA